MVKLIGCIKNILQKIKHYTGECIFSNKLGLDNDEWFFILPYGIGDTFIVMSLLKTFKLSNSSDKISIGIVKKNHKDITSMFEGLLNRVIIVNKEDLRFCPQKTIKPGVPIILHPTHLYDGSLLELIGFNGINLADIYKIILNLPVKTKPCIELSVSAGSRISALKRFESYGSQRQNLVVLAPHAVSIDESFFSAEFWEKIICHITGMGFTVGVLSRSEHFVENNKVINIDFPLIETIPFLNLCHTFIGVRSGLCDLAGTAVCRKIILYPDQLWYSGTVAEGSSIEAMGLTTGFVEEMIIRGDVDVDVDKIMGVFRKK